MTQIIPEKYTPFVSIALGILVAFLLGHDNQDMSANILAGILFGLAASGLYSGLRASTAAIKAEKRQNIMEKNKLK